jgi:hypothetical protein
MFRTNKIDRMFDIAVFASLAFALICAVFA